MNENLDTSIVRELCCLCLEPGTLNINELASTLLPANNKNTINGDVDDVHRSADELALANKELSLIGLMSIFQNTQVGRKFNIHFNTTLYIDLTFRFP